MRRFRLSIVALVAALLIPISLLLSSCSKDSATVRAPIALYPGPAAQELAVSVEIVPAGASVTVRERHAGWVRVRHGKTDGWLPDWYLSQTGDNQATTVAPRLMFAANQTGVLLTPVADGEPVSEVGPGRAVQVTAEFGDFAYVRLIALSVPDVQRGWIRKMYLVPPEQADPREGLLRPGTIIHQGSPDAQSPSSLPVRTLNTTLIVRVLVDRGSWLYLISNGGWDGWVEAHDFVANPFEGQ